MIPPEPDPPEPVIPEYTYSSSQQVTLGSTTGTLYKAIQYNGSDCKLITKSENLQTTYEYPDIILFDNIDPDCYFVYGTTTRGAILGSNSSMGLTVPSYLIYANGTVNQSTSQYIDSSTPSDYYSNIKSRNFTLVQR